MSSNGALPQTLKSITATKIKELSKQRVIFDQHKKQILATASEAKDLRTRAQVLLDGISRLKGYPKELLDRDDSDLDADADEIDPDHVFSESGAGRLQRADHANIRRFLLQSRYDSSISQSSIQARVTQLETDLRFLEIKHEHGAFYSNLVTEWLSELDESTSPKSNESSTDPLSTSDLGPEPVGRAEMHEQRATWESLGFNAATHVNEDAIHAYLSSLFTETKLSREAFTKLRTKIQTFGADLLSRGSWLDVDELKWVSEALLKADLLNDQKAAILKEFMRNKEVAQEVADVLNMRLASLESWSWTTDGNGIPLDMRRQLNGKYRFYMDEDLLDALLLQYIGTKWAVRLRVVFVDLLWSREWKLLREDIADEHINRRKYSFGRNGIETIDRINDLRRQTYVNDYFMTQLPTSEQEGAKQYDEDANESSNPLDTKHSLLHLLITESIIHKHQHGEFTAIRSDFEWFGPSMPHTTVLAVLKFFGFSETWLKFFAVFLEAPLKFSQDGGDGSVQTRKRGLPMSHTLGDCFGEAVLFCMDYAVNQRTDGAFLYRLHDDFWFWGAEQTCGKAWEAMNQFSQVMGLKFNQEKTGTVRMGSSNSEQAPGLPLGDIRWGFLVLDASQERFIIDQTQVDQHIEELSRQLSSCKSVFAWVQAWNSYFGRFFTNNFAKPAVCFGRSHIDMAISTLHRIEQTLFNKGNSGDGASGVTEHLRAVIAERFDIHNLPDGFFYYPIELGGLGLLNPFIRLLAMRENIKTTPRKLLHKASLKEEVAYEAAKEKFKKNGGSDSEFPGQNYQPSDFMSFEDYSRYAETYSVPLRDVYKKLNEVPEEKNVALTLGFGREKDSLGLEISAKASINQDWDRMTPYWCWVAELYYEEMVQTYGGLAAVNREFMPLGVVKTLREGRFRWQG